MTKTQLFKIPAYLLSILTLSLMLTANSLAANFTVKIAAVVPRAANGDVVVQFDPGTGETRFTERSRGLLLGDDTGTNKVMAVLLTAITLGQEVKLDLPNTPSFAEVQVINSTSLIAIPAQ